MNETKHSWDDVSAGCNDLGSKLKTHFSQARDEDAVEAKEALRKLADAVGDAFEAVGKAARDPEVRPEARKVAISLGDALGATFAGLGDEVRKVFTKKDDQPTDDAPGDAAASWAPPATQAANETATEAATETGTVPPGDGSKPG